MTRAKTQGAKVRRNKKISYFARLAAWRDKLKVVLLNILELSA